MGEAASFAAGYEKGYDAGLAAARRQLTRERADAKVKTPGTAPAEAGKVPLEAGEPVASEPAAGTAEDAATAERLPKTADAPAALETETPLKDENAALPVSRAGMPAPLRGSLASLERQNDRVEADGLERILDEADLENRIEHKLLVPLPVSEALTVNPNLEENFRYCRSWTARFLTDLARAHEAVFHKPIQVNSAVRTVEYQKRLMYRNGNAAAAEGDIVSPHLTGATIDIAKRGMSRTELAWMRRQLLELQQRGKIDVEEEFAQACFHITVYRSYGGSPPRHRAAQPSASQGAAVRRKAEQPAHRPLSQLPADLAAGVFNGQGR